jgi:hypothetical protein
MDTKRLEQCVYDFREGGEKNGHLLFQARLFERGRPRSEYNLWLSTLNSVLTCKVDSFDRGHGFAYEILKRTIPERLEQIARDHGPFTHNVEFTPQGRIFKDLIGSLGYQEKGNFLVKDY